MKKSLNPHEVYILRHQTKLSCPKKIYLLGQYGIHCGLTILACNCPLMLFIVRDNTLIKKDNYFPNYVSLYQKALLVVEIYYFPQDFHD